MDNIASVGVRSYYCGAYSSIASIIYFFQIFQITEVQMGDVKELDAKIRASYITNVNELTMLWMKMGLSKEEIETRTSTVVMKISDITTEMVECDRENKMKIEEACHNLKKDIRVMMRKLKKSDEPEIADELTLLEQQKQLKMNLVSLEKERNAIMGEFR